MRVGSTNRKGRLITCNLLNLVWPVYNQVNRLVHVNGLQTGRRLTIGPYYNIHTCTCNIYICVYMFMNIMYKYMYIVTISSEVHVNVLYVYMYIWVTTV